VFSFIEPVAAWWVSLLASDSMASVCGFTELVAVVRDPLVASDRELEALRELGSLAGLTGSLD